MKKKKPLTDAQKAKIRASLPVMTPEEEKAEMKQIKALFKEYHVSVFAKIKRNFKQWREDRKLRNERVNEDDDKK
jgi:ribosome recycling factor